MNYKYNERVARGKVLGGLCCLTVGAVLGMILAYACIVWTIDHMLVEAAVVK